MEPSDSPLLEPAEYKEKLERAKHIESALEQHNKAVELLRDARRDRALTSDPQYDGVIRELQRLEQDAGDRLARSE